MIAALRSDLSVVRDGARGAILFVEGWTPSDDEARRFPMLDDEIAAAWGMRIIAHRHVLRGYDLPGVSGRLEIAVAPDLRFDRARRSLPPRIAPVRFTDRQIASRVLVC